MIGMKLKWFYFGFYATSGWRYEKCHCFLPNWLAYCCKQPMKRRWWGVSLSGMNALSGFELGGLVAWVWGVMCVCLLFPLAARFSNCSFKTLTHSAPGLNQRTLAGDVRSSEGAPRAFGTCVGLGKVRTRSSAAFCAVFPNAAAVPATASGCQSNTRCSESRPDCFPSSICDRWAKNCSCDINSLQYTFAVWHQLVVVW